MADAFPDGVCVMDGVVAVAIALKAPGAGGSVAPLPFDVSPSCCVVRGVSVHVCEGLYRDVLLKDAQ